MSAAEVLRERVAEVICAAVERGWQEADVASETGYGAFEGGPLSDLPWKRSADAVLAMLREAGLLAEADGQQAYLLTPEALAAHDREVAARALREAGDDARGVRLFEPVEGWLRKRADRIEAENATT